VPGNQLVNLMWRLMYNLFLVSFATVNPLFMTHCFIFMSIQKQFTSVVHNIWTGLCG